MTRERSARCARNRVITVPRCNGAGAKPEVFGAIYGPAGAAGRSDRRGAPRLRRLPGTRVRSKSCRCKYP
ncbi:hypothetical protein BOC58_25360 [Burkholderia pseudomallei]|nr:hypothetical protein BOC58_25360 [Burkholderia pseudomallei]